MIDLDRETIIRPADVARLIPSSKAGSKIDVSTVVGWIMRGSRGIKLERLRTPAGWVTSKEAVARFVERLTEAHGSNEHAGSMTPTARRKAAEKADRELEAMGV